jgi:hypothetical protein
MQINQPRTHHPAGGIQSGDPRRRASGEVRTHGGDFPVQNQHIRHGIQLVGGIDYPTPGEEQ